MVKGSKHHATARGHLQSIQTMVFGIKISWHAAIDFAVLANAAPEWHALQFSIQRIAPLVVRTDQFFFVAMALTAKCHATVCTHIFDHMDLTILTARHDHRTLANRCSLEVTHVGNFCF